MCQVEYRSHNLFKMHSADIHWFNKVALRSHGEGGITEEGEQDLDTKFIITGSAYVIAASEMLQKDLWILQCLLK